MYWLVYKHEHFDDNAELLLMYVCVQSSNHSLNLYLLQTGGRYQSLKFMQLLKSFPLNLNLNKERQNKRLLNLIPLTFLNLQVFYA